MTRWQIKIDNLALGGFAPMWWKNSYCSFGNKNHASDMTNMDLTDPNGLTQGPGLAALTAGTQAGAVTTLIKSILDKAVAADTTYATGGAKLYQLSSTAVTNAGIFPHTIDKAVVTGEDGEDVAHFGGKLYYSYNYTSVVAGDIGRYDLDSTFIDAWGSTTPVAGATALRGGVPHQFAQTAEFLYITNGIYITEYDLTNDTITEQSLDLPTGSEAQSHVIANDRLHIAVNETDLTGSNKCSGAVYKWDRNSDSWDADSVFGLGRVGALYVKSGAVFVFHQDVSSTGGYHLGYIDGNQVKNVASYKGSLPGYHQVTEYQGFIIWESDGLIYAFGSGGSELPVRLFQIADGGYSTVGGLACPFGTPMIASYDGSSAYKLAKFSGYDTACNFKSLVFDISKGIQGKGFINKVVVNFDTLAANSRVDLTLTCDLGASTWTGTMSYTGDGAVIQKIFFPKKAAQNFRVDLDWTNGNATNAVKIRNISIEGHLL